MSNQIEHPRHLALVPGEPAVAPVESLSFRARPGDRCEPWTVEAHNVLTDLGKAAGAAEIGVSLAGTLVVERSLLAIELREDDKPSVTQKLDSAAARARVMSELTPTSANYLRALGRCRDNDKEQSVGVLQLPMRLSDRILRIGLDHLIRLDLMGTAISWERASVLSGRTMSEWAMRELATAG